MDQRPICRICGKPHWSSEPHVFESDDSTESVPEVKVPVKKRAERGMFDRVAYQREYMRRRRAKSA